MIRSSNRHLSAVGEDYFEHLGNALAFSSRLATASVACAVHAIVPGLCTKTASRSVADLHAKLVRRGVLEDTPATARKE